MKKTNNPIRVESIDDNSVSKALNFMNKEEGKELSNFNLIHFFVNPGAESVLDQHQSKEYWFVMKGNGALKIDGELYMVSPGELYFFNSMVSHQIKNINDSQSLEILSIWW